MNLQETLQLLDKLGSMGAKRFKSNELEIDFGAVAQKTVVVTNQEPVQPPPSQPINQENTRKVQALIDLLKAKDEELVNTIFPEGA